MSKVWVQIVFDKPVASYVVSAEQVDAPRDHPDACIVYTQCDVPDVTGDCAVYKQPRRGGLWRLEKESLSPEEAIHEASALNGAAAVAGEHDRYVPVSGPKVFETTVKSIDPIHLVSKVRIKADGSKKENKEK